MIKLCCTQRLRHPDPELQGAQTAPLGVFQEVGVFPFNIDFISCKLCLRGCLLLSVSLKTHLAIEDGVKTGERMSQVAFNQDLQSSPINTFQARQPYLHMMDTCVSTLVLILCSFPGDSMRMETKCLALSAQEEMQRTRLNQAEN